CLACGSGTLPARANVNAPISALIDFERPATVSPRVTRLSNAEHCRTPDSPRPRPGKVPRHSYARISPVRVPRPQRAPRRRVFFARLKKRSRANSPGATRADGETKGPFGDFLLAPQLLQCAEGKDRSATNI